MALPSLAVGALVLAYITGVTALPPAAAANFLGHETPQVSFEGTIFMGGFYFMGSDESFLSSVEVMDMDKVPDFPDLICDNTVTTIGSVAYACGGWKGGAYSTNLCFTLDASEATPEWNATIKLPAPIYGHSAAAVSSHIWFISRDKIYDLETLDGRIETYDTPFEVDQGQCAVSNSTHSLVIGVGVNFTEIWVNTEVYSPAAWEKVGETSHRRLYAGCVWHDNQIIMTGGKNGKSVEILDLDTMELKEVGDMPTERMYHSMFMLDGKPAVVGGYNEETEDALASIDTYDVDADEWTTDKRALETARFTFGLGQFVQY